MAKNELGFGQEEFAPLTSSPFERADEGAQAPGEELGALEVAEQPRFPVRRFAPPGGRSATEETYVNETAIAEQQARVQEMQMAEAQRQEQEAMEAQSAEPTDDLENQTRLEKQGRNERTRKAYFYGKFFVYLIPPYGIYKLAMPLLAEAVSMSNEAAGRAPGFTGNIMKFFLFPFKKIASGYSPYPSIQEKSSAATQINIGIGVMAVWIKLVLLIALVLIVMMAAASVVESCKGFWVPEAICTYFVKKSL